MRRHAPWLSLLCLLALALAWYLLRPGDAPPTLPAPAAPTAAHAPTRASAGPPMASPATDAFLVPDPRGPGNRDGAAPPDPPETSDDPRMQAALAGELPTGLGPPPSQAIEARADALRECWTRHHGARGAEGGVVPLRYTVVGEEDERGDVHGRVETVRVVDLQGQLAPAGDFEICARAAVEDLAFVAPEEGSTVEISVPLALEE